MFVTVVLDLFIVLPFMSCCRDMTQHPTLSQYTNNALSAIYGFRAT